MLIRTLLASCLIAQGAISDPPPSKAPVESPRTETSLIAIFSPPSGWQSSRPKHHSTHVQIGFIGEGSSKFHPSINLAVEEIDISLKEYVKAVKEIHLDEKNTTWRDLGKFTMKGGSGRLTEITSPSAWGDVKMLQAILVSGKTAYILTAAALKKEYPEIQKEILQSLQSLDLQPDLFASIADQTKRKELEDAFANLGRRLPSDDLSAAQQRQWEALQVKIVKTYPEMGSHWQYLALSAGHAKIYNSREDR